MVRILLRARKMFVGESHVRTNKNIIFDTGTVPYLDSRLYRYIITYNNVILNQHISANVAIAANLGIFKDDTKLPDIGILTNIPRPTVC